MQAYGAGITVMQQGTVVVKVPAKDFLLRTSGIFHGGVIAAVADTAAGYAAVSCEPVDANFLTVEFKISFLSKARGEWLEARATVIKNGRTLTVVSVDVIVHLDTSEKLVATVLATFIKENQ